MTDAGSTPADGPVTRLPTGMPADAPSTSVSVTTSADPARLWTVVTDVDAPAAFSEEFLGATWKHTDGVAPPGLGARFVGRNDRGDGEYTTLATVTVHDEPRRFGWTVQALDDPVSDWLFVIDETAAGATLTYRCRLGPSPLSGLTQAIERWPDRADRIIARRLADLEASMQRTVAGLAGLAEVGRR